MNIPWAKIVETLIHEADTVGVSVVSIAGESLTDKLLKGKLIMVETSKQGVLLRRVLSQRGIGQALAKWKGRDELRQEVGSVWIAFDLHEEKWRVGLGLMVDVTVARMMEIDGNEVVGMEVAVG